MNEPRYGWQFGDVFEAIAEAVPERPALIHGDRMVTWADFDARSDALAADLLDAGLSADSKLAVYVPNRPEYMEAYHAAQKISVWPFNVNYRYGPDEIAYLLDNADTEAVVFDTRFVETVEALRHDAPAVRRWYAIGDDVPAWATDYATAVSTGATPTPARPRTDQDIVLVYTGGTTGMPKGVMWPHGELFTTTRRGASALYGVAAIESLDPSVLAARPPGPVTLLACPLMHATALSNAYSTLAAGGTVVLLPGDRFDAAELWDTVDARQVQSVVIVGDAFARPMLAELEAQPNRWSLTSLRVIHSAGVMWSHDVKDGLFRHLRNDAMLIDVFGSTEAAAMGNSVSTKGKVAPTASFQVGELAQVLSESGGFVEPGSGEVGLAAFGGPMPLGYYKDQAKTDETFRTVDGKRWSVPGDFATVEADGSMTLLGRGSVCINTGGEKVFVEEVEEVLKLHDAVRDAVCVGIPDERFGETVCAVIEPSGLGSVEIDDIKAHVKGRLAGYKAPRDVVVVDTIGRAPSGKVDYKSLRAHARTELNR